MPDAAHIAPIAWAVLVAAAAVSLAALLLERAESRRRVLGLERERTAEQSRRLDDTRRGQGSFVANLSHELRSPLNSVLTLSQLLLEGRTGALNDDQRKYLEVIGRSGQNLLELVSDVLDLSRIEAGLADIEIAPVDVEAAIRSTAEAMRPKAVDAGIVLDIDVAPDLPSVAADPERAGQILVSLVGNAVRFAKGGHVVVSAWASSPDQVSVSVSDDGPGMTEEISRRTFRELFQSDQPLGRRHGRTGLGLTICYRLVHLMGGHIKLDSEPGRGSTFTFTLPAARDAATGARTAGGSYGRTLTPPAIALGAKVLVIEDDDMDRMAVTEQLREAGFDVVATASGREGLDLLRDQDFDAAIIDLVMPEVNGLDILEAARADPRGRRTPFVVLSAMYLTKTEREVLGSVAAVVRKGDEGRKDLVPALRRALAAQAEEDSRATVLVVEDDPDAVFTLRQVLAPLRVNVETAATVDEAVRFCRQRPPDLVFMDAQLRGTAGFEDPGFIRRLPRCSELPIVGLTSGAAAADRERTLRAGFNDCLVRPFRPLNVLNAATRYLGNPAIGAAPRETPRSPP